MGKESMKAFSREHVYNKTLEYFKGDSLAANVWIDKYCLKDSSNFYEETPDDMHKRLAREFARIEQKYPNPMSEEMIYELLKGFKYIVSQGGGMAGIGNNFVITSLSNCFVIGNEYDSYSAIMRTDEEQVHLMRRRGGVGSDISHLRPSGAITNGVALEDDCGATLYMNRLSNSTREVSQGKRRGAKMISISSIHPDVEKFIDKKMVEGAVTGANISVRCYDDWLKAAFNDEDYLLKFPTNTTVEPPSLDELEYGNLTFKQGAYFKKVKVGSILDKIVYNAWKSAEPGLILWDKVLSESPAKGYGSKWEEKSTNPCGEIPLSNGDSCRLMALNLTGYVINPYTKEAKLNAALLFEHAKYAQRLMDDFVDLELEKLDAIIAKIEADDIPEDLKSVDLNLWKRIRQSAIDGRRTGLGHTAIGDMMAMLGLTYGTTAATNFAAEIQQLIASAAYEASVDMAEERGAFAEWEYEKDMESAFLQRMFSEDNILVDDNLREKHKKFGRRNIGLLTIAPTGTVSLMTQTTSGIECVFLPSYWRSKKTSDPNLASYTDETGDMFEEYAVFHRPLLQWYVTAIDDSKTIEEADAFLSKQSKEFIDELVKKSPYYKATTADVDYVEKIRMQGEVQKWVDHSISVTVNMPQDVDVQTVKDVYKMAWESGCKGVTVYRDGSRLGVLNATKKVAEAESFEYISAHKRPKVVNHDVYFRTAYGVEYVIMIGIVEGKPYEIMAMPYSKDLGLPKSVTKGTLTKNKSQEYKFESDKGHVINNIISHMVESEQVQTRDYSTMLRHRVDPMYIIDSIESYATISSLQKNVAKILRLYVDNTDGGDCPECGGKIAYVEGCLKCLECGYSKCG